MYVYVYVLTKERKRERESREERGERREERGDRRAKKQGSVCDDKHALHRTWSARILADETASPADTAPEPPTDIRAHDSSQAGDPGTPLLKVPGVWYAVCGRLTEAVHPVLGGTPSA